MSVKPEFTSKNLSLIHKISVHAGAGAPLALLVHGRAGNVDVMSTFYRSIPASHNILSVQAPYPDPIGGFSWWMVDEQGFNWSLCERSARQLGEFLQEAMHTYKLEPRFIYALGFSQGSAILSVIAQQQPQRLRGLAILAGFVVELENARPVETQSSTAIFWAHGSEDSIVRISRALRGVAYLQKLGFHVDFVEDPVGHKVGKLGMARLKDWQLEL